MNFVFASLKRASLLLISVIGIIFTTVAHSEEIEETVLGMNVSGNKEAPNLLYIIPWKASTDELPSPKIYRLMDEVYSTVDPDVFQKEVQFFDQLVEPISKISGDDEN
jgi:hypothetical protein